MLPALWPPTIAIAAVPALVPVSVAVTLEFPLTTWVAGDSSETSLELS